MCHSRKIDCVWFHSFIHSFIVSDYQLYARLCAILWGYSSEKINLLARWTLCFSRGRKIIDKNKLVKNTVY